MRDPTAALSLETIRRAQTGDARAWEKLVQQYAGPVFSLCYRFAGTPDKAEDLSQEAFIKLFQNLNRFDPDQGSFSTWMSSPGFTRYCLPPVLITAYMSVSRLI